MNQVTTENLSPDTEAILLLCGRFGREQDEKASPLTQKEYESLVLWLMERKLRPSDLLGAGSPTLINEAVYAKLDPSRVKALLGRGTAMALSLEKWQRSGLWVLSRGDATYPARLKKKLGQSAPPLLFGAGDASLLDAGGLAIVGSRDVSEVALEFTRDIAGACARDRVGVISGGAKGVDSAAMQGAGEAGGVVIGVLAADLLRASINRQNRDGIQAGKLVLVSPFNPEAGFNAGNAMARNRFIYALADYALVVDSAQGEGGTWAGAIENLRYGWVPLLVRTPGEKAGNVALIAKGGLGFAYEPDGRSSIRDFLDSVQGASKLPMQAELSDASATTVRAVSRDLSSNAQSVRVAEPQARYVYDEAENNLADASGVFQSFVDRLTVLLQAEPKDADSIRQELGLEMSLVKNFLAKAVDLGYIEKHKRPVSYSLSRQKPLC